MKPSILALALLIGCTGEPADTSTPTDTGGDDTPTDTGSDDTAQPIDVDGDGDPAIADGGTDCDDSDSSVYPGAKESCDTVDSDCDGDLVDGFDDLDRDAVPDCADSDPCTSQPPGLLIWLQGDDTTDTMNMASLSGTADFSAGIVGDAVDLTKKTGLYDSSPDSWLVSPISVEAWINTTRTGDRQMVLAHYECGGECNTDAPSQSAYTLSVDAKGNAIWVVRDADTPNGVSGDVVTGQTDVADGQWHHLLAVLDPSSGELALYVNGELDHSPYSMVNNDGSGFAQDALTDIDPITIGYLLSSGDSSTVNTFSGLIDELSVYSAALTESDAQALHGAGIAGKCE